MKVLVIATSRKTRGGITAVVKAHERGEQWSKYHCRWIETHRDGPAIRKIYYLLSSFILFLLLLPFYDLVHIHIATLQSARRKSLFLYVAKMMGKKVILHFHPSNEQFLFSESTARFYSRLFNKADLILVLSSQWIKWLEEALGAGAWYNKTKVLYNPCPVVNRIGNKREKQILYAGTLLKRKGYDVLLKGFARIAKKHPDWNLVFAGNPYLKEGINELENGIKIARELGIIGQVKWLGWVAGSEKESVFQKTSIYCLASDGEGFPMGVLEAWAYGIPCVMTPVGGIPDIVKDGVEGLLFPVGNAQILAEQLERMISNEELRNDIVNATDQYVYGDFNIAEITQKLGDIYESFNLIGKC